MWLPRLVGFGEVDPGVLAVELACQLVTCSCGIDGVVEYAAPVDLALELDHGAVPQNIIAQHGANERAAEALNQIAWACRNLKQGRMGPCLRYSLLRGQVGFRSPGG